VRARGRNGRSAVPLSGHGSLVRLQHLRRIVSCADRDVAPNYQASEDPCSTPLAARYRAAVSTVVRRGESDLSVFKPEFLTDIESARRITGKSSACLAAPTSTCITAGTRTYRRTTSSLRTCTAAAGRADGQCREGDHQGLDSSRLSSGREFPSHSILFLTEASYDSFCFRRHSIIPA